MTRLHIPGRVVEFWKGGGAWQAWNYGKGNPGHVDYPDGGELELFQAVAAAREIRPKLGGYYVAVELSPDGIAAARYWAETCESASADNAREGDEYARSDLRAARKLLLATERPFYPSA